MCDPKMLELSDNILERLEKRRYRPEAVVRRLYEGFGVLSVEIVNTAETRPSESSKSADTAVAAGHY